MVGVCLDDNFSFPLLFGQVELTTGMPEHSEQLIIEEADN